jgi:predicted membrane protein
MDNDDQQKRDGSMNRIWIALVLVAVGGALFLQQAGVMIPDWLFNWKMLLIVIGIFMGFSHGFRGGSWAVLILIGGIFLLDDILPGYSLKRFAWPLIIITTGLFLLVRPRHHHWSHTDWERKWKEKHYWRHKYDPRFQQTEPITDSEDFFDSTSFFGGVKKVVLSKNFRGGDVVCFMGGCEIDLMQADFQTKAVIDITQVFGGTKLIVPSNWKISTQMTAFFGSIEDKRQSPSAAVSDKTLVIEGTSVFGSIEIRNYG